MSKKANIYITGDTHGRFEKVVNFCDYHNTNKDDIMIILGDAGINYYGYVRDYELKKMLSKLPITLFCIHGNHEERPFNIGSYKEVEWHGGKVYVEEEFDNIIFAKDGEIYDFNGKQTIVIGGAYSVDKEYRILRGWNWFHDEQPSIEIKEYVEKKLASVNWKVDIVLSHTTPYKYRPTEMFLNSIDQSKVDSSTEIWLDKIEDKLDYNKWYAGHYHCDKIHDKIEIMFNSIKEFNK